MRFPHLFTLLFLFIAIFSVLIADAQIKSESNATKPVLAADSIHHAIPHIGSLDSFLLKNQYLNAGSPALSLTANPKTSRGKEFLFYILGITILLLAIFKVFYAGYFNNIFRVFFNTSLRQNQLTDLLLQAKLPSLIFNIFFVISAGLYAWLLLYYYRLLTAANSYRLLALSILFVAVVYCGKYLTLKFMGWITGMSVVTDRYIFVIFLINKITGILLIPFIILLAFAPASWLMTVVIASLCMVSILFLLRYLRTYGLLQNQLHLNAIHFLLYGVGMELLPILIIYKLIFRVLL